MSLKQREHETQVGCDGGLAREQELDLLLDFEVLRVDVVVERDHLVREFEGPATENVLRPNVAQRAGHSTSSTF